MLIEYLPELIPAAIGMILTLVHGLVNNLPLLIDTAIDLILAIVDGLINSLPIIIEMAPQIIEALINGLVYAIPQLLEAAVAVIVALVSYLTDPNNLAMLIESTIAIMFALLTGMIQNMATFVTFVPQLFKAVVTAFANTDWGVYWQEFNSWNKGRRIERHSGLVGYSKRRSKKSV